MFIILAFTESEMAWAADNVPRSQVKKQSWYTAVLPFPPKLPARKNKKLFAFSCEIYLYYVGKLTFGS